MIKRINLAGLFCRSFYIHKCHIVKASVSTSVVCLNKKEKNFIKLKKEFIENYEDTFGNIDSFEAKFMRIKDDPEDILEYKQLKAAPGKTYLQYIKEIKSLLEKNDYKAALKLFEIDMRNDRIRNPYSVYKILINYNSKSGNLEEAFRLYIDFKERGNTVTGAIYTSMFNACANCRNSLLALKQAEAVRGCMNKNKYHKINISNYNAMMKAYGRHGDLATCLKIMDEILDKKGKVKCDVYSFLLQSCITDKNSGLRHAFLVWRKMLQHKTIPNLYSFNLMLRCIRDCSLGEIILIPDAVKQIIDESKYFVRRKLKIKKTEDEEITRVVKILSNGRNFVNRLQKKYKSDEKFERDIIDLESISIIPKEEISDGVPVENQTEDNITDVKSEDDSSENKYKNSSDIVLPNLLSLKPTIGSVIEFKGMTNPQERFMLVGGVNGFLKTMAEFKVKPDLKTFTLMLSLMPHIAELEEKLISVAESYEIVLDTGFYNVLLKRRICREDHHLIKDCLDQMHVRNLQPDIQTFGILALSCKTHESCIELLDNLHKHGFRVNSEIIDALLKRADESRDMKYVLTILRAAKEDEAYMDARCLAKVSFIIRKEKRRKLLEEENKNVSDEEKNLLLNEEIKN